jgi:twinkle protein
MEGGDERRMIDNVMTKLRSLVEELKFGLILVSHLKRPEGKGHEDGARTSLAQLRGSAGIAQLSDMVIGMERDQQDVETSKRTTIRILKNRWCGKNGIATILEFDEDTGRLAETEYVEEEEPDEKNDF